VTGSDSSWSPRGRGSPGTSTTSNRLLAQLGAKAGLERPILVHALLETGLGGRQRRSESRRRRRGWQGMSFGPADLAASRRMKTTRVGGGHPGYRVLGDPDPDAPDAPRPSAPAGSVALFDSAHGRCLHLGRDASVLRPVRRHPRCGGLRGAVPAQPSCSAAVGAWSLHPAQIEIAKRVFSPDPDEVAFAKRVLEAIPDGRGVHMLDARCRRRDLEAGAGDGLRCAGCSPTRTRSYAPSTDSERGRLSAAGRLAA